MNSILKKLVGSDRRSIGNVNAVVTEVLKDPSKFENLMQGFEFDDPVLLMRCADAVEKITVNHPEYLFPYKKRFINKIAKINRQEVRWHVAQIFSRLKLTKNERIQVINILLSYLEDKSKIVKTFSIQAMADIAENDDTLKQSVINQIEVLTQEGSPAVKSRGRKLLYRLKQKE